MSGEHEGSRATDKVGALLAAAGAAMVVGFFLPWVDFGSFGSASGLDAARASGWTNHALALAPLAGVGLILLGMKGGRDARSLGVLTGVVVFGWGVYQVGDSVVHDLRWGGWLAIAGAAALAASGASKQKGLALVAGALAAAAFFLPWYGGASGFDIARGADLDGLGVRLAPVWLALGGAVLGAVGSLGEKRGRIAILSGVAVLTGVLWPYVAFIDLAFGLGAWLTLGGAAAAFGLGVASKR